MTKLRGHVDRVDKMLIAGWAISEDDPTIRPEVQVVQEGSVIMTLRPLFPAHDLRKALGLPPSDAPPLYHWRLWLPLSNGVKSDIPFSILLREGQVPLAAGQDRIIDSVEDIDDEALSDLKISPLIFPGFARNANGLSVWVSVYGTMSDETVCLMSGDTCAKEWISNTLPNALSAHQQAITVLLSLSAAEVSTYKQFCYPIRIDVKKDGREIDSRIGFHNNVRTLQIPKTVFDESLRIAEIPDDPNLQRVSGPSADQLQYIVGGATTFLQLNAITEKYFQKPITQFMNVVDWGVGCGRVVRNFWELAPRMKIPANASQQILGLDIDEVNIEWCTTKLRNFGRYALLSLDGFDLPSKTVDLLYGISVMTHLSEHNQHLWLSEIRRILRPGGCAILTVHGERVVYRDLSSIALPFVEKFGFFDGIPDTAIGADRQTYYRATYHARSYIRSNWGRYFDIVDFIPAANAFSQDFVVLRRPAAE